MKIKTIDDLENYLVVEFGATISSVEEINKLEEYSLVGDKEHDYNLLKKVYKIKNLESKVNPYDDIFYLVFSKHGGIYDVKGIGEEPKEIEKIWKDIEWEEN